MLGIETETLGSQTMKFAVLFAFPIGFLVLLSGCTLLSSTTEIDERFSLRKGAEIEIRGERLFIKFIEVKDDSRCYKSLYDWYISQHHCASAGQAKVVTRVRKANQEETIEFWVSGIPGKHQTEEQIESQQKTFLTYEITALELSLRADRVTFIVNEKLNSRKPIGENRLDKLERVEFSVNFCAKNCSKYRILLFWILGFIGRPNSFPL